MTNQDHSRAGSASSSGWPFGDIVKDHDQLGMHLQDVGTWHARRALRLFTNDDGFELLDAAYSIGAAVELLAKSLLASVSPFLLLPSGNIPPDSIQKYAGVADAGGQGPNSGKVKSLDAAACLARVLVLGLGPVWSAADTNAVLNIRNAAAHLGLVERSALNAAMGPMVRFSEHARERNGMNPDQWWGTHDAGLTAAKILSDELTEWEWRYHAKVAAAREGFNARWGGQLEDYAQELLRAKQDWMPTRGEYADQNTCPACHYQGWAYGSSEDWGTENEHPDGTPLVNLPFSFTEFTCNVCGLHLSGPAELTMAGIPTRMRGVHETGQGERG